MPTILVDDLSKTYYTPKKQPGILGAVKGLFTREKVSVEAVKNVSFSIEEGEVVGFLGPNGAGKTTTLKVLSGILFPTSGKAEVLGYNPWDRRPEMLKQISLVMGNKMQLWWDLPAWDSFQVLKEIYEVSDSEFRARADFLVETLQLEDKIHTQVRKLSLGERMKCELVAALLHNPKVIFLDEPTIGLDVVSQKNIREFLKDYNRETNSTIILTSHYMQDVAELCERIIVIDHGKQIFEGSLASLSRQFSPVKQLRLVFSAAPSADLSAYGRVVNSSKMEAVIEVPREETTKIAARILQDLPVEDISIDEADIEDVIRELFTRKPDATPV
ncbi:MAG: ATP-binding cassette domain-containing protein [Armatimonadetes bacterium]|nr:ATP-binding cassette domain-containing protein [Armatimonadota bacterium]